MPLIRNKKTGEVKEVNDAELSNYGIGGVPQAGGGTTAQSEVDPQLDQFNKMRQFLTANALQNLDPTKSGTYTALKSLTQPTAYETSKLQESKEIKNITGPINTLRSQIERGEIKGYADIRKYNTQRNLTSQSLAKLIERNRLSDTDRTFYLSNFPKWYEAMFAPDFAKSQIDVVEKYLTDRLGENVESAVKEEESKGSDISSFADQYEQYEQ